MDESTLKLTFLYTAIGDAQATIRATDYKTVALLLILGLPLTKLGRIFRECSGLAFDADTTIRYFSDVLMAIFSIAWLAAFRSAVRALNPVDNPSDHIDGEKPSGVFYSGDLFKLSFCDIQIKSVARSKRQIEDQLLLLPPDSDRAIVELSYQHMSLVYIRTLKMARLHFAFNFGFVWIITGGIVWILSLIHLGH